MLFDMHVHTHPASPCAHLDGKTIAEYYKKAGFDGIVITDHFIKSFMVNYGLTYEECCNKHMQGYLEAKHRGDEIGLTVLYGCELRFQSSVNDYLVYGMTNDFLLSNLDIFDWTPSHFKEVCEQNGFVFYQAHPFRNGITIINPDDLFGIEVFNGGYNQRNDIANIWAEKYNLHKISGSDCHSADQLGVAGVAFYNQINDEKQLVHALLNDEYMLVERTGMRHLKAD